MLEKLNELRLAMAQVKTQGVSMRRMLNLYWLSMVLAVFAALLLILSIAGVYSNTDRQLCEFLSVQQQNTVKNLSDHMDALEAQCVTLSGQLTEIITDTLTANGSSFDALNNNEALITTLEEKLYTPVYTSMHSCACSGVFVVLNATANTHTSDTTSFMGLYLRYSDLNSISCANKHMVYFRGMPEIARREQIQMHNRWNLEIDTALIPGCKELMTANVARLADHCIWTERMEIKDTWEDALLLLVPVLDSDGKVCGVCGMELSELYFRLSYPAADSDYGSIMTVLAPVEGSTLSMGKSMLGGGTDLSPEGAMTFRTGRYYNTYSTGAAEYLGLHQVLPAESYSGRPLVAVTLISADAYERIAAGTRAAWIIGSLSFLLVMLLLSHFLSKRFTTPITQLLSAVQAETPPDVRSGISEIDQLADYIRMKAKTAPGTAMPPNIDAMLKTFVDRLTQLTITEREVFELYAKGLDTDEVAKRSFISESTVKKHLNKIYKKLCVSSRGELMLYIEILQSCGLLEQPKQRER